MKIINVNLKEIEQNENSRVVYKETDLSDLMHSMKQDGLLQPIGVKKLPNGKYEAVFGNRRIIAAKKLGWADIPATIVDALTNNDRDILNLVENLKRQNTTVSEDGRIFQALKDRGLSESEIAARVGLRQERVALALEVFNDVPADLKRKIVNRITGSTRKSGTISATAAHAVLNLRKRHSLSRKQTRALMHFASQPNISTTHVSHIAPLVKEGFTIGEAVKAAGKMSRVVMYVFIDETKVKALENKYEKSISTLLWEQLEKNSELGVRRLAGGPRLSGKSRQRKEARA